VEGTVQRQLTITIDEEIYQGLREQVGTDHISEFIEELVRPHLMSADDLEAGYRAMAADTEQERKAKEWADGLIGEDSAASLSSCPA
jgi:predicted CopG family antitoxin